MPVSGARGEPGSVSVACRPSAASLCNDINAPSWSLPGDAGGLAGAAGVTGVTGGTGWAGRWRAAGAGAGAGGPGRGTVHPG